MRRIWQIKLLFTACMLAALIVVGGRCIAQIRHAEQSDRDDRRLERKVEGLQKDQDDLKLEIEKRLTKIELDNEKRLTKIETYNQIALTLTGLLFAGVLTQLGMRLFDLIVQRRVVKSGVP